MCRSGGQSSASASNRKANPPSTVPPSEIFQFFNVTAVQNNSVNFSCSIL
jgi:hypothetical protein